jgi:predicted metal-dependent enzyme (double-stranded beta helix superfamily)
MSPHPTSTLATNQSTRVGLVGTIAERRAAAIEAAMADIRAIEDRSPPDGLDREGVEAIRDRLLALVAERDLFPEADFPPPGPADGIHSILYRLAEDDDGRHALYANACADSTSSPPHDHTTWAVIVGFDGEELNRIYDGRAGGGEPTVEREVMVERGSGVAFLPDEVHSIHIEGGALNLHCYGRALERLDGRRFWDRGRRDWRVFPAHPDIRDARVNPSRR